MTLERFRARAAAGGLVPVWTDILLDTDTPVSAFAKLRRDEASAYAHAGGGSGGNAEPPF